MLTRNEIDYIRIETIVKAFIKLEMSYIYDTFKVGSKVGIHYLTISTQLATKISNSNNTLFVLKSADKETKMKIKIGKKDIHIVHVTVKEGVIHYDKRQ